MPKSVRLNDTEQEKLYKQMIKCNQKLSDIEKRPIQETDIVHFLLGYIEEVKINEKGEIYLNI